MHIKYFLTLALASALFLGGQSSYAAQVWDLYNFKVKPGTGPKVLAAFNALQESKAGSNRTASVHLQRTVFGGNKGTTHSIVALYPSRTEFERANRQMAGTKPWTKFQESMAKHTEAVNNSAMETLMGWGTVSNNDTVWEAVRVNVTDPQGVVAALNAMMASDSAQAFPGQVWLSAIEYGNASDGGTSTHVITVGYESMAEMEAWNDAFRTTETWALFNQTVSTKMNLINRELVQFLSVYDHQMSLEDFKQ